MKDRKLLCLVMALAVVALLVCTACGAGPTPTPYPTFTPYPTYTPFPTATPVPTDTPQPTLTPTVTPNPVEEAEKAYLASVLSDLDCWETGMERYYELFQLYAIGPAVLKSASWSDDMLAVLSDFERCSAHIEQLAPPNTLESVHEALVSAASSNTRAVVLLKKWVQTGDANYRKQGNDELVRFTEILAASTKELDKWQAAK